MATHSTRKQIRLTRSERATLKAYAARQGMSTAQVVRDWLDDFVKNGSDIERNVVASFRLEPELLAAAEKKAREEYDIPVGDIIHHEIARLR